MTINEPITTGEGLPYLAGSATHRRPPFTDCPRCGKDAYRLALVEIAYTFEVCECGEVDYAHLVEQFWHRTCVEGMRSA